MFTDGSFVTSGQHTEHTLHTLIHLSFKMLLGNPNPKVLFMVYRRWNNGTSMHCLVVGCCGEGFNSDSLPILQSLSSGHTGKMVKKVCPCNQLCSNYLSFWSFLPPFFLSSILALALPRFLLLSKVFEISTIISLCQFPDQFNSVISVPVKCFYFYCWHFKEFSDWNDWLDLPLQI